MVSSLSVDGSASTDADLIHNGPATCDCGTTADTLGKSMGCGCTIRSGSMTFGTVSLLITLYRYDGALKPKLLSVLSPFDAFLYRS